MFRKDFIVPAVIGLGIYSQTNDISLCSNTTLLLMIYLLLQDHQEIEHLRYEVAELEHGFHDFRCQFEYPRRFARFDDSRNDGDDNCCCEKSGFRHRQHRWF